MKTNEIVKNLRITRGYKQKTVAAILGIPYTTYNNYESGRRKIGSFMLMQIAQLYGVTIDSLLGIDSTIFVSTSVPTVIGGELDDESEFMFLTMPDGSMEPRIFKNDQVVIRKQSDVNDGEVAAVKIKGGAATIRKIMIQPQGYLVVSLNAGVYPPAFYAPDELEFIGKAIEVRASLNRWD